MWSAWAWVKRTASIRGIFWRIACFRRSVEVSTRMYLPEVSIRIEERVLLSRGSSEVQTRQLQPTIGTPVEVPLPRMVIFMGSSFGKVPKNNTTSPVQARGLSVLNFVQEVPHHRREGLMLQKEGVVAVGGADQVVLRWLAEPFQRPHHLLGLVGWVEPVR